MLVTWRGEAQIRRYFWVFSTTETARGMLCKNRAELPPRDEAAAADSWGWGCGRVQWAGSSGGTWHQWPSRRRHYHSKTTKPSLSPIATLIQSPDHSVTMSPVYVQELHQSNLRGKISTVVEPFNQVAQVGRILFPKSLMSPVTSATHKNLIGYLTWIRNMRTW